MKRMNLGILGNFFFIHLTFFQFPFHQTPLPPPLSMKMPVIPDFTNPNTRVALRAAMFLLAGSWGNAPFWGPVLNLKLTKENSKTEQVVV